MRVVASLLDGTICSSCFYDLYVINDRKYLIRLGVMTAQIHSTNENVSEFSLQRTPPNRINGHTQSLEHVKVVDPAPRSNLQLSWHFAEAANPESRECYAHYIISSWDSSTTIPTVCVLLSSCVLA